MSSYSPSTISRIGDIHDGMLVQTAKEISYLNWGVTVQASLFTVYNRVWVHALWGEVGATALVGATAVILFNFAISSPAVVAAAPLNAASATIHAMATGGRFSMMGGTIATATSVDTTPGISMAPTSSVMVGRAPTATADPTVGQLGCLSSVAVLTAGTAQFSVLYTPIDPGAYVEALM